MDVPQDKLDIKEIILEKESESIGSVIAQKVWQNRIFPFPSGILKYDGTFIELCITRDTTEETRTIVSVSNRFPIANIIEDVEFEDFLDSDYNVLDEQCESSSLSTGVKVVGGGGSLGADGFVTVLDLYNDDMKWIAFFEDSNPFVEVGIKKDKALAVSNLDYLWTFEIHRPEIITIEKGDPKGYDIRKKRLT